MEQPEFFVSTEGVVMAIITFAEYERLRTRAAPAERLRMPNEFMTRIELGANKLRVWREYRGLSVSELAMRTKLTTACIAQIENGSRTGSINSLKKLALTLGVSIDDLV